MTVHNQQLYENSCLYVSVNAAVCLCEDLVLISFSFFPDVCVCACVLSVSVCRSCRMQADSSYSVMEHSDRK